jgi:DNA invertase Pin-like site-specific DNA recombinase
MLLGYARAHSRDPGLQLQRAALQRIRCDNIIEVTQASVKAHREALTHALSMLRKGDTLVVRKLDRMATSLKQWMTVSALLQERGIHLRVLEDDPEATGPTGELVDRLLVALAEYGRARDRRRSRAERATGAVPARRRGRPRGTNESKRSNALALRNSSGISITEICKLVGISRPTFYRYHKNSQPERSGG